ncbi:hypothetical protein LMG29542_06801 [Paraburkholderia humisilvae]|uniref:NAD-dependent epimerase/dehydratase domain-containing protein n=2 Tax=Paraburkholderia humisilvae TaxID=627669 RepID=A0A6J5EZY4_9BURK|nr:hypothetical protein LMG29542_06801 [Paraburkholderia humisilvae]
MKKRPILVTGATGKTGRRVVHRLTQLGMDVRSASRSSVPAFRWEDESSWAPTLSDVGAAYVVYCPEISAPTACRDIGRFARVALANDVRRLVLLSGRNEPRAQSADQALMQSGADWTIIRASWFAENFSEDFLLPHILAGEVALPVADVGEPFVSASDIADVAVAALTDERHIGRIYEVTGPRLLSFRQAATEIAVACRRSVSFTEISRPTFRERLAANSIPPEAVRFIDELFRDVLDGRSESLGTGIQEALGRAPTDFADYARETAKTGIWHA